MTALLACSVCAQQTAPNVTLLVLAFLATPFAVAAAVIHVIRHADS